MSDDRDAFDALLRRASEEEPETVDAAPPQRPSRSVKVTLSVASVLLGILIVAFAVLGTGTWEGRPGASSTSSTPPPPTSQPELPPQAAGATTDGDAHEPDEVSPAVRPVAAPITDLADPTWLAELSARSGIPLRPLSAYTGASIAVAEEYPECGLGWNTLAAIGQVESEHGTIDGSFLNSRGTARPPIVGVPLTGDGTDAIHDSDGGALDGDPVWDRAVGPMQFIPQTWRDWATDGGGDGIADPQNIDDAALSAARYLCHVGGDLTSPDRWIAAIAAYNDTVAYNHRVAEAADSYAAVH